MDPDPHWISHFNHEQLSMIFQTRPTPFFYFFFFFFFFAIRVVLFNKGALLAREEFLPYPYGLE